MRAIERLTGDRGARELLARGPTIECANLSSGRDVDTREDLDAISDLSRVRRGVS
jgi:CTP:molybdopterin cytidylyltransferase MocA